MTIKIGDRIPNVTIATATAAGPQDINTDKVFSGKKVVLFAVPGAYTPTCTNAHLPGYVTNYDAFKAKGVDTVACMAVNDAFVMGAWGEGHNPGDNILMLADGSGALTEALGLEFDLSDHHLGVRSKRFAMIVDDGVVKDLRIEDGTGLKVSAAEELLAAL